MSIRVDKHYQLIGTSSDQTISRTLTSPRKDVWVAVAISGVGAMNKINQISQKIQNVSIQSPASFYSFLQRILEMLVDFEVELSIAWISGARIVLGAWNGDVLLHRNGKVGRIVQAGQEIKMIEGDAKVDDVYMCFTRSGSSVIFPELLQSFPEDFESVLPKYVSKIQESGLGDRTAGLFFSIIQDIPQSKPQANQEVSFVQDKAGRQISGKILKKIVYLLSLILRWFHTQFQSHPKFRYFVILLFSVVALLIAVLIGAQITQSSQDKQASTFLAPFQQQFSQIQTLESSDQLLARDQANSLLIELQSQRQQYTQKRITLQIDQFEATLREYYKSISGKIELTTLPIFYDFRLIQSDFINTSADVDGSLAVFADREKKTVILVNLDTKEQKQLPLGDYSEIRDVAFDKEKVWILGDGVYEYTLESEQSPEKVISSDEQLSATNELGVFDDAVYAFSSSERNIFRYVKDEEGKYGVGQGWIQDKQGIDFSLSSSIAIDGAIWLSFQDGKIIKFERGSQVNFEITGLEVPIKNPVFIFTKPEYENLYLLEPEAQRVVEVKKDGTFIKEVNSPSLVTATQLVVREETKKGYVLAGSVVYEVEL